MTHEVQYVDFDLQAGVLAGEAVPQGLVPTAEAIGAAALPANGLYFAAREPRPSRVAKAQLDWEDGQAEVRRRRALRANRATRRDVEADPGPPPE